MTLGGGLEDLPDRGEEGGNREGDRGRGERCWRGLGREERWWRGLRGEGRWRRGLGGKGYGNKGGNKGWKGRGGVGGNRGGDRGGECEEDWEGTSIGIGVVGQLGREEDREEVRRGRMNDGVFWVRGREGNRKEKLNGKWIKVGRRREVIGGKWVRGE